MKSLPDYVDFKKFPRIPFSEIFSAASDDLLDLLEKLFLYDPVLRIDATQVCYEFLFYFLLIAMRKFSKFPSQSMY